MLGPSIGVLAGVLAVEILAESFPLSERPRERAGSVSTVSGAGGTRLPGRARPSDGAPPRAVRAVGGARRAEGRVAQRPGPVPGRRVPPAPRLRGTET